VKDPSLSAGEDPLAFVHEVELDREQFAVPPEDDDPEPPQQGRGDLQFACRHLEHNVSPLVDDRQFTVGHSDEAGGDASGPGDHPSAGATGCHGAEFLGKRLAHGLPFS
jgi:hypothetical protein